MPVFTIGRYASIFEISHPTQALAVYLVDLLQPRSRPANRQFPSFLLMYVRRSQIPRQVALHIIAGCARFAAIFLSSCSLRSSTYLSSWYTLVIKTYWDCFPSSVKCLGFLGSHNIAQLNRRIQNLGHVFICLKPCATRHSTEGLHCSIRRYAVTQRVMFSFLSAAQCCQRLSAEPPDVG